MPVHVIWMKLNEYTPQCRIESGSNFAKAQGSKKCLSYIGPSLWNNLPGSMGGKKNTVLNTFKQNLKKQYLGNLAWS